MPKKEDTPLQALQKAGEALMKKVNAFEKECNGAIKKAKGQLETSQNNDFYRRCQDLKQELDELPPQLEELDAEGENMKQNKLDNKKKDEAKKHKTMEDKLAKIEEKLEPEVVENEEEEDDGEEEETVDGEDESEEDEAEEEEEDMEDEEESAEDEEESEEEDVREPIAASKQASTKSAHPKQKDGGRKPAAAKAEVSSKKEMAKKQQVDEESEEEEFETDVDGESEMDEEEYEEEEEEEEEEEGEEEEESGEEEEESGEDEETEDEENTEFDGTSTMRQYIALDDFNGEQEGDLSFTEGEVLTIIMARSDGWLEAENAQGRRGLVPITYLKVYNKYKDLEASEDDEDEEVSAAGDYDEDDDDDHSQATPHTPKSARDLWKDIKSAVSGTSATDVLHALGAMPAGFRESSLAKLKRQDKYGMKSFLTPKLSQSCVSFRDLFLDPATDMLRQRQVKVQKVFTIIQARQIPLPGTVTKDEEGVEVLSRHVRVCLSDGVNIISNIHTIKVASLDKDQKTWNFSNKVLDGMKSVEFGEFFVRSNSPDTNIGLLVELCLTYRRNSNNKEGELSCGWVHFKLFDQEGRPVPYKTYDEFVNGGNIHEKGVDVDPSVGKKAGSSKFRTLMAGNKQPRLVLRLSEPTKDQKGYLDVLPDVVISSTAYISYIALYRQALADLLLKDRSDLHSIELIYSPMARVFPEILEQPDLMDVLRMCWAEEMKVAKRSEKKDVVSLKDKFRKIFFQNIYPITQSADLPSFDMVHEDIQNERQDEMQRISRMNRGKQIPLSLLSPDVMHKPLDIAQLSFNIVNPHCSVKAHGI